MFPVDAEKFLRVEGRGKIFKGMVDHVFPVSIAGHQIDRLPVGKKEGYVLYPPYQDLVARLDQESSAVRWSLLLWIYFHVYLVGCWTNNRHEEMLAIQHWKKRSHATVRPFCHRK